MPKLMRKRSAVAMTEGAVVLSVLLVMVLAMFDLGMGQFRAHVIAGAARHGARQAIVHGEYADGLGHWGPEQVGPIAADDGHPLAQAIRPHLVNLNPADVAITAEWPDGGNEVGHQVRVTISTTYQPFLSGLFGSNKRLLAASSTMRIAH